MGRLQLGRSAWRVDGAIALFAVSLILIELRLHPVDHRGQRQHRGELERLPGAVRARTAAARWMRTARRPRSRNCWYPVRRFWSRIDALARGRRLHVRGMPDAPALLERLQDILDRGTSDRSSTPLTRSCGIAHRAGRRGAGAAAAGAGRPPGLGRPARHAAGEPARPAHRRPDLAGRVARQRRNHDVPALPRGRGTRGSCSRGPGIPGRGSST